MDKPLVSGVDEFNDLVAKIATWEIWLKYFFFGFLLLLGGEQLVIVWVVVCDLFNHLETKIAMWEVGKFVLFAYRY